MTWTLRRATADDLAPVMAIETATFVDDAWSEENMASELRSAHGYYLVAVDDTEALGGYAGLLAPAGSGQGDIQTIAVVPAARRHGLGRRMLRELLAEAERRGAHEVFLEVRADNPGARALYDSEGFEQIAVRPGYYPGGVDAEVLRRTAPGAAS